MTITFRPLQERHLTILFRWLKEPHVKALWDQDIDWSIELVQEKYGSCVYGYKIVDDKKKPMHALIICTDGKEIGYIQLYNAHDFAREDEISLKELPQSLAGFDIFIGDPSYVGKGYGTIIMKQFLREYVFPHYDACFVDPNTANEQAILAYEKAGFKKIKTIKNGTITWMIQIKDNKEQTMTRRLLEIVTILGLSFGTTQTMQVSVKPTLDYIIRKGKIEDRDGIKALYLKVAAKPGGLARTVDEITDEYITKLLQNSLKSGIIFVAELKGRVIGSIIKNKLEPKVFSHVLTEGSILVDPDYQKKGIGKALIKSLQEEVKNHRPEIYRVEIIARESNPAIKGLYTKMSFKEEGRFEGRIKGISGKLEADIPMAWFNPNFKTGISGNK